MMPFPSKASLFLLCMICTDPAKASEAVSYVYNARGQMVQASTSGLSDNAGLVFNYQYDVANNRLSLIVTGSRNRGQQVVVLPLSGFKIIPINP